MVHLIATSRAGGQIGAYLDRRVGDSPPTGGGWGMTDPLRAGVAAAVADDLPVSARYLPDGRRVVLPTLKVKKGRVRVSCTATHRSR